MEFMRRAWRRHLGARIHAAERGRFGDVRGIENPQDGAGSMLFGDRRGRTPKTEGGGGVVRASLRVYPALIFFFLVCPVALVRAQEMPRVRAVAAEGNAQNGFELEIAELVARSCPRVVLGRAPRSTLRDLVRNCDVALEREAQPGRTCDEERDGLCVK